MYDNQKYYAASDPLVMRETTPADRVRILRMRAGELRAEAARLDLQAALLLARSL